MMVRPRAADDFVAIRARMDELRRERLQAEGKRALSFVETPRDPRSRNAESEPVSKPKIGLFRVRDR